ncbi:hypothetical protein COMNV_00312 [Commensalibacter sp. Nvir]|uniref:metallophosphoesterase n=1 Tax=Commensalibacter sp. Nvir TaxID=3069817 RepID=UPI002D294503|nr:hypothetical protein COMNV_00312 [Commensalibacter sp. Nvir]
MSIEFLSNSKLFRIIGDVHGDIKAFGHAVETDKFIIQLGDLVDYGPDSAGVLDLMLEVQKKHRGLFIIGNHDRKLGLYLKNRKIIKDSALTETIEQIQNHPDSSLASKIEIALERAPAWLVFKKTIFVHAGFHPKMLFEPPPDPLKPVNTLLSRALYGEVTKKTNAHGYPIRKSNWINQVPQGYTLYCGHECRSTDGRPWKYQTPTGATIIFMDTGAGKGGHLSWIDITL